MGGNLYDDAVESLDDSQRPPSAGQRDPLYNEVTSVLRDQDAAGETALRRSFHAASSTSPDRAADSRRLALTFGVPAPVIERNFEEYSKREQIEQPYRAMQQQTPHTAAWLQQDNNAALAKDDLAKLGTLEWLVTAPQRAFQHGLDQVRGDQLRYESMFRPLTQAEQDLLSSYRYNAKNGLGADGSWFRRAIAGSIEQLPMLGHVMLMGSRYGVAGAATTATVGAAMTAEAGGVGAIPAAPVGYAAGAAYGTFRAMGELSAGQAYERYLALRDESGQPLNPDIARAAALGTGVLNGMLGMVGLEKLVEKIPGLNKLTGSATRSLVEQALKVPTVRAALLSAVGKYAGALTTQAVVGVGMEAANILGGEIAKQMSDQSFAPTKPEDVFTDLVHAGVGAVQDFAVLSAFGPAFELARGVREASVARHKADYFAALGDAARESKTMQRAPEAVRQLIERATENGPIQSVYAPVDSWVSYWQSKQIDPVEMARRVTGEPDALEQAQQSGTDLKIPTSRYATTLAPTEHNAFFARELRLNPNEMNAREAEDFLADAQKATEAAEAQPPTAREQVRRQIFDKLVAAHVPPDTAEHYARLVESGVGTMAESAGLDPFEVFQRYGVDVQREGVPTEEAAPAGPVDAEGRALGGYAGPERRSEQGVPPEGVEERRLTPDKQVRLDLQNPELRAAAAALEARARDAHAGRKSRPRSGYKDAIAGVVDKNADVAQNPEGYFNAGTRNAPAVEEGTGSRHAEGQQPRADEVGHVEGGGDGNVAEPGRLPSAKLPFNEDGSREVFARQSQDVNAKRLTPEVRREIERILDELQTFPYEGRTWTWLVGPKTGNAAGGAADVRAGHAGAEVYHDIIAFSPINERAKDRALGGARGTRNDVARAAAKVLEDGDIHNNLAEGVVRVAQNRAAEDYEHLSAPALPASWGREAPDVLVEALSDSIDKAVNESVDEMDVQDADTSFEPSEFGQGLFDALDDAILEPEKVDTLDTGEQQPRLPGAENVRDQNVATPEFEAPFSLTPPENKGPKGKQRTLFQSASRETSAFKSWFGDSEVVDEDGNPLVVYHGSDRRFSAFEVRPTFRNVDGRPTEVQPQAFFFSEDKETASMFARDRALVSERLRGEKAGRPEVRGYLLSVQQPLDFTGGPGIGINVKAQQVVEDIAGYFPETWNDVQQALDDPRIVDELKAMGYDGAKLEENDGSTSWAVFSPEQIKSVNNRGTFDAADVNVLHQERRGSIQIGADRQIRINLFARADLSTFLHETGHFFLEVFGDLSDQVGRIDPSVLTDQQRRLLADYGAVLKELGVENREQVTREQHEQFARMFEAYLFEGKAPSLELRSAFARFRAWLIGVYRQLRNLNAPMSDDVRGVFDRMLASDRAISEAEAAGKLEPLFTTPESAGMSPEEFGLYRAHVADASRRAREELDTKLLAEVRRTQEADYKAKREATRATVEQQTHAMPVYQALAAMQRGTRPDGTPLIEGRETPPLKLSRQIIVDRYGEERLKSLPKPFIYTREGGIDPDLLASEYGFSSGDELLRAVSTVPSLRDAIEGETDRRMLSQYGSLLMDGTLPEKAQLAAANDHRDAVVRSELRALWSLQKTVQPFVKAAVDQATKERDYERRWLEAETRLRVAVAEGRKQSDIDRLEAEVSELRAQARGGAATIRRAMPSAAVLRDMARERVARTRIVDLEPALFWSASRRAAQSAIDAAARQEFDNAITAKTSELVNLALFREAERAKEDADARIQKIRDGNKDAARARLGKAGDAYLDQWDAVLDRYDFAKASEKVLNGRESMLKFVESLEAQGLPVDLPDELMNDARRVHYSRLTYEELVGVSDGLQQIVHLARLKNRLLKAKETRDFTVAVMSLDTSIRGNTPAKKMPLEFQPKDLRARKVAEWFASHSKLATLARSLDGYKDGGMVWEHIIRPINEAATREALMNTEATTALHGLIDGAYSGRELARLRDKLFIPAIDDSLSKEARLAVALNWGNEGNRQRLRDGRRWTGEQVQAILDTLDERDWKFVQGVWDFIDTYWPEIEAKQKRVTGIAPEKVAATPVQTRFGEFRGGYYPIAYDRRLSARAGSMVDASDATLQKQAAYVKATTRRGHTEARAARVVEPVRLELSVLYGHVEQVIHDLSHHEMLIDVGRLLGDKRVQQAIYETHGDLVYDQMKGALKDIAFGTRPAADTIERALNFIRQGTTVAGLAWNVWTAVQQPIGVFNGMARVGPVWVTRGIGRMFRDAASMESTAAWISERSDFMRTRGLTQQREIAELRNTVTKSGGWFDNLLRTTTADKLRQQDIADSYFALISAAQRLADMPTWIGAYEKAMAGGETEKRAVALADQAVLDAQGGGQIKDLAQVQRGSAAVKLFTNFYSYGNLLYNQTAETFGRTDFKRAGSVGQFIVNLSLLYAFPAAATVALAKVFGKGNDDDSFLAAMGKEMIGAAMNTMVLVREFGGLVRAANRGYEGPTGTRAIKASYDFVHGVAKYAEDREVTPGAKRATEDVASIVFRLPVGQVQRSVDGFVALQERRTKNPLVLVSGAPKESK